MKHADGQKLCTMNPPL